MRKSLNKKRKAHSLKMIAFTIWLEYFCQSLFAIIRIWKIVKFAIIEKRRFMYHSFSRRQMFPPSLPFLSLLMLSNQDKSLAEFPYLIITKNLPEFLVLYPANTVESQVLTRFVWNRNPCFTDCLLKEKVMSMYCVLLTMNFLISNA